MADIGFLDFGQLQQHFALFVRNFLGDFDMDLDEQVTRSTATWVGHPAASNAEDFA